MTDSNLASPRLVKTTLIVCSVVAAFATLVGLFFVARKILPLVIGAVLIAVFLNRLAHFVDRLLPGSLSRGVRIGLVLSVLTLIMLAAGFLFANSVSEQVFKLTERVESSVQEVVKAARDRPIVDKYLSEGSAMTGILPSSTESLGAAKGLLTTAFGGLADCLILLILSIYFCVSPGKYRDGTLRLIPPAYRGRFSDLLNESSATLWRWTLGRLLAMSLVGIVFGGGLMIIGIPMAVELGVFAGLVTFIPNIGGIAAVIPALLLASQKSATAFWAVAALYLVIQFVESYLITPLVQEHQVSLPPAMVVVAQILAGLIFGFWGIAFATPMVAVIQLWINRLYVEGWIEQE